MIAMTAPSAERTDATAGSTADSGRGGERADAGGSIAEHAGGESEATEIGGNFRSPGETKSSRRFAVASAIDAGVDLVDQPLGGGHVGAQLAGRLGAVRFARNEEFATNDEVCVDGDIVAVIPPVAGG